MKICISSLCFQRGWQKGRKNRYDDVRGGILSLWKALVFLLLFSFFLTYCLSPARYPLSITFQSVVSRLDHRDSGSLLASGVANKKDKEQMVVFVIPSSFQPPGKPLLPLFPSLSPSLSTSLTLSLSEPQRHLNGPQPLQCEQRRRYGPQQPDGEIIWSN